MVRVSGPPRSHDPHSGLIKFPPSGVHAPPPKCILFKNALELSAREELGRPAARQRCAGAACRQHTPRFVTRRELRSFPQLAVPHLEVLGHRSSNPCRGVSRLGDSSATIPAAHPLFSRSRPPRTAAT
jgi:hypothetical protein